MFATLMAAGLAGTAVAQTSMQCITQANGARILGCGPNAATCSGSLSCDPTTGILLEGGVQLNFTTQALCKSFKTYAECVCEADAASTTIIPTTTASTRGKGKGKGKGKGGCRDPRTAAQTGKTSKSAKTGKKKSKGTTGKNPTVGAIANAASSVDSDFHLLLAIAIGTSIVLLAIAFKWRSDVKTRRKAAQAALVKPLVELQQLDRAALENPVYEQLEEGGEGEEPNYICIGEVESSPVYEYEEGPFHTIGSLYDTPDESTQ